MLILLINNAHTPLCVCVWGMGTLLVTKYPGCTSIGSTAHSSECHILVDIIVVINRLGPCMGFKFVDFCFFILDLSVAGRITQSSLENRI